jgi:ABC-type antimicrobial peptide transport system permease subunit
MGCWKENYELMNIKIAGSDVRGTLAFIKRNFDETFPNYVYESKFLDQKIQNFYVAETRLSGLYSIFAFIAIFISCLGLYGLVSFMAAQKTKEVGIRKVLGASTGNILYLFSKEFTILIIVAFLIASPIAYYIMSSWLADFAYRITPGVWLFLLTILGSLTIAWITVSYKAIKAAHTNPAKTLKYE